MLISLGNSVLGATHKVEAAARMMLTAANIARDENAQTLAALVITAMQTFRENAA
jgi:hypothetical protein